ncbi:hypothetical protein LB566_29710 [Mesorhizobium sp. CA13]|uniref:hypothetical protein n=1 Tax=Mesorhizobium sp. CA13 TaxID=2876643 RepID=UPI001CD00699|nr:hypothetical protein [Mesorhizobium sp. CA13]MBZ9857964.1 hypothetical protein [Mesorhizobium sp. CA13]
MLREKSGVATRETELQFISAKCYKFVSLACDACRVLWFSDLAEGEEATTAIVSVGWTG